MILFHREARASDEFACTPDVLYEILTDYDSYKEWVPGMYDSALLAKEGELAIASMDFAAEGKKHVSVECIHTTNRGVLSRSIEGETLVKSIEWTIEPAGADRSRLTLAVELPVRLDLAAGGLPSAKSVLKGLRSYASAYGAGVAVEGEQGETLVEINETENGLTCWFNGQQYEMKPLAK
jgi:ribosome-associated toxin RatA of RatAB toxin-antitoxin module